MYGLCLLKFMLTLSISVSALVANINILVVPKSFLLYLVFIAEPELWCPSTPRNISPLNRRFPTGGKLVLIDLFSGL